MVDIGKLNKRITFLKLSELTDDMGQTKTEWVQYRSVWATVKPFKSSEYNFMGKLKPETTHRFYVRYNQYVTADMRILYHGRTFEISGPPIDMDERHEMLEIQATEVFEHEQYGV